MTTSNKKEVSEALDCKDFDSAFNLLLEYGGGEFISYCLNPKKKLLEKGAAANYFFQKLQNWSIFFEAFEFCERVHEILEVYFLNYAKLCPDFEVFMALKHSNSFIAAIRANEVYLQPKRLKYLLTLDFGSINNLHKKAWTELSKKNEELKDKIIVLRNKCSNFSNEEVLFSIVLWIEKERIADLADIQLVNRLADAYSFIIENVLVNAKQSINLTEHEFNNKFISFLGQENNQNYEACEHLFNAIYQWRYIKQNIIDIYSFQLSTQPYIEDGSIYLLDNPSNYYKWKETDVSLNINTLRYKLLGVSLSETMEKDEMFKIGGKTEKDISINKNCLMEALAISAQLQDLCITELRHNDNTLEIFPIINSLKGHSTNSLARYEESLTNSINVSQNTEDAILRVFLEHFAHQRYVLPFVRLSKEEFADMHLLANKLIDKEGISAILNTFCWSTNIKSETNEFQSRFDVKDHPFVLIGKHMFIPSAFFANANWVHTLSESNFKRKDNHNNSICFEGKLKDAFKKINLEIVPFDFKDKKGDVDVLVSSDTEILLIQVKRTKFRASLKDQYLEYIKVDCKGARQLNEAELFLTNIGYINGRKVTKWIVSNSFERVGDSFSGCTKINYFDLLALLSEMKGASLNEITNKMENPKRLLELCTSLRRELIPFSNQFEIEALNKSLFIENFESKAYKLLLSSSDPLFVAENLFNEATLQYNNGNLQQALDLYLRCLTLKPNDGDVYGAIANVFADFRDYTQAKSFFTRALELLPNDPHMLRNIAGFLWEAGNFSESIKAYIKLFTLYPLIDLHPIEVPIMFQQAINSNLLTEKEIMEIEDLIQKMNGV